MRWLSYIFIFFSFSIVGQNTIELTFTKSTPLNVPTIAGVDNFETLYYINKDGFYKKTPDNTISYSNVQLGSITTANTFNPLKITLFYKNFNTVIILDNRLAEIFKIDFNTTEPYKSISHISTGNDNTLWVFNQDLQRLELYDYKAKSVRATTIPVTTNVLDLKSDYNYCWLLTEKFLYKYNYFGSLLLKIPNTGFSALSESNERIILQNEQSLFFLGRNSESIHPIKTPKLFINQFLLTNETLYIYDNETLQEFQLKIK